LLREQIAFFERHKKPTQAKTNLKELLFPIDREAQLLFQAGLSGHTERELLTDVEHGINHMETMMVAIERKDLVITRPITVLITNHCPWRCGHCSEDAAPNKHIFLNLHTYLERFKHLYGDVVMFSGGEPFDSHEFNGEGQFPIIKAAIGHFRDVIVCTTLPEFTKPWHPDIRGNSEKKIIEILKRDGIEVTAKDLKDGVFLKRSGRIRQELFKNNAAFRAAVEYLMEFLGPFVGHVRFSLSASRYLGATNPYLWQNVQVQMHADELLRASHGLFTPNKLLYYCVSELSTARENESMFKYGVDEGHAIRSKLYGYGRAKHIAGALPPPRNLEPELVIRQDGLVYNNKYDARSDPSGKKAIGSLYKETIQEIVRKEKGKHLAHQL
jgi:hypothetical protein